MPSVKNGFFSTGSISPGPKQTGGRNRQREGRGVSLCLGGHSLLSGSYGISLWRHLVIRVDAIEAEVVLKWDEATRYCYMTVWYILLG
ncbi:hypothetical protein QR685DRAFT_520130 [Neurospora intermedia]|uniref:Questionable protein n=1 Tax=Neurospora intermedia TaxID=5142 RepID=A0ABR3DGI3_NEUIN